MPLLVLNHRHCARVLWELPKPTTCWENTACGKLCIRFLLNIFIAVAYVIKVTLLGALYKIKQKQKDRSTDSH